VTASAERPLSIRVARLEALFTETQFVLALPELDPGPALDHLVRRLGDEKFVYGSLRVCLVSEPASTDLQAVAATAIRAYCRTRAEENRATVRAVRRNGRRAMLVALCLTAVALGISVALARFELLPGLYNKLIGDALVIAGWVVLWRPMELLFYEWIEPWRAARDYERLAQLPFELCSISLARAAP
jgi:hypothetical protein